jgi:hypothetical protein
VGVSLLQEGFRHDEFTIIISYKTIPTSVVEVVLLSTAILEELQVDAYVRRFVICDRELASMNFSSLQSRLSGVEIAFQKSLNRQLCYVGLERLFFGLWNNSAVNSTVTLSSVFAVHSRLLRNHF